MESIVFLTFGTPSNPMLHRSWTETVTIVVCDGCGQKSVGTRGRIVWEVDHVVPELVSSVTNPLGLRVRVGHVIGTLGAGLPPAPLTI
jgi:hypothetical protein